MLANWKCVIQTRLQKHQKDTYASFARIEKFSHLGHKRNNIAPPAPKWKKHLEFLLSLALQEERGDGVTQAKTVEYGSVSKLCCRMFWAIDRSKMSYVLLPRR